jgi:DNA-binding IclR family transcriptional regulator
VPGTSASPRRNSALHSGGETPRHRSPLTRGLQTLDRLREQPSTISELARVLGVNRSTVHRLVQELEVAGYIERDSSSRRFLVASDKLATPSVHPGATGGTDGGVGGDWAEASYQALRELRDLVGESTMFAVPARDRMLYIAFFSTDHPIGVQEAIGSARPMHASAVGKAYLSALPLPILDIVLGRLDYSSGTDNAAKGPFQLRDMLDEVREQGYAIDHDETFVGLSCVATSVIVNGSTLVGAAGITGLTHRFGPDQARYFGALLVGRLHHLETK